MLPFKFKHSSLECGASPCRLLLLPTSLPRPAPCCRGEGWGLPVVEAMAMALPVIVTNWSGPTAYLDDTVGYPLRVEKLVDITQEGAFQGRLLRLRGWLEN